ncbi:MAG TPA: hypothetical protein VHK86_08675 [Nitrososphaera sp.]|nr:hypothetical protein [Nitrososphaera sp.]
MDRPTIICDSHDVVDTHREYSNFAAKRYRQHKWEKRKESLMQQIAAIILRLLQAIVKTLQDAGVMKRRAVEKVAVE